VSRCTGNTGGALTRGALWHATPGSQGRSVSLSVRACVRARARASICFCACAHAWSDGCPWRRRRPTASPGVAPRPGVGRAGAAPASRHRVRLCTVGYWVARLAGPRGWGRGGKWGWGAVRSASSPLERLDVTARVSSKNLRLH
jgi:hypothetical protein